jgi:hypothetical protein
MHGNIACVVSCLVLQGNLCVCFFLWLKNYNICCWKSYRLITKICDWAKFDHRLQFKSIWVTRLLFCQNHSRMRGSFWQKDSLITHILFELQPIIIFSPVANFGDQSLISKFFKYCHYCISKNTSEPIHFNPKIYLIFFPKAWNSITNISITWTVAVFSWSIQIISWLIIHITSTYNSCKMYLIL